MLSASSAAVSTEQSQQLVNAEVRLSDLQGRIGPLSTVRSVCLHFSLQLNKFENQNIICKPSAGS